MHDQSRDRCDHTCSGNVYGGGQGYVEEFATHRWNWVHMGRVRNTSVTVNGGRFMGNCFGGGSRGVVKEDCHVTIHGGRFGTIICDKPQGFDNYYYYGSVFGGGYGNHKRFWHVNDSSFLYPPDANGVRRARPMQPIEQAGRVYGNTYVIIDGGHIMDCVFGGGDMASTGYVERDVTTGNPLFNDPSKRHGGVCDVRISGNAIIGPLDYNGHNAYVYGAGRGVGYDPQESLKTYSNVNEAHVTINLTSTGDPAKGPDEWNAATDGGRIWGSLFGGGADSHVLGDVSTTVHSGVIGTDGVTSYDGNIFGGGRNYLHSNSTNGRVQGNIDVLVDGGTLRGSIFGGGRMAQSGVDSNGLFTPYTSNPENYGNVTITVTTLKHKIADPNGQWQVGDDSTTTVIGNRNSAQLLRANESLGDIFGSGKGDTKDYDLVWAGRVTNTQINVSGSPTIYGAVFGGGEMASVGHWNNAGVFYTGTGNTNVNISGSPTIGTADEFETYVKPTHAALNERTGNENPGEWTIYDEQGRLVHSCTGNVFGASQGDVDLGEVGVGHYPNDNHWIQMARSNNATVNITGSPRIRGSVLGGSEQGMVAGNTHVTVNMNADGHIGTYITHLPGGSQWFGDIYGGGYGSDDPDENNVTVDSADGPRLNSLPCTPLIMAGRVYGNTLVDILGGEIDGSIYGGGERASVGYELNNTKGNTQVNIGSAEQHENGGNTVVIHGSVYGANNFMGTPMGNANVDVYVTAHTEGVNDSPGDREGHRGGCVASELLLVVGAVDLVEEVVDSLLVGGVHAGDGLGDLGADVLDGLLHSLSGVPLAAVAELVGLPHSGGRTGGCDSGDLVSVDGDDRLDGGVSSGVQNFPCPYFLDCCHINASHSILYSVIIPVSRFLTFCVRRLPSTDMSNVKVFFFLMETICWTALSVISTPQCSMMLSRSPMETSGALLVMMKSFTAWIIFPSGKLYPESVNTSAALSSPNLSLATLALAEVTSIMS